MTDADVAALRGFRELRDRTYARDLAPAAAVVATPVRGGLEAFDGRKTVDAKAETYWSTDDGVTSGSIELRWARPVRVGRVVLGEAIALGQRVQRWRIEREISGRWTEAAAGTTIGRKRIVALEPSDTSRLRVEIDDARACLAIATLQVF